MGKVIKKIGDLTLDIVSAGTMGDGVVGGITGQTAARAAEEQADLAAKTAKEQKASIAEQEKLIADEQAKQDKVAQERRIRLAQQQLLSGSETGAAASNTLLGVQ